MKQDILKNQTINSTLTYFAPCFQVKEPRPAGAPFSFKLTTCTVEARTVKDLAVFGEPGRDGVVELSFTLSVDDSELTARAPDGADDLPSLNNL